MKMSHLLITGLLFSPLGLASEALLIGSWNCRFSSDLIDADETLTLAPDQQYEKHIQVFAASMVDQGRWSLSGNTLILDRQYHTARGQKKASQQVFRHEISKLSKTELAFSQGEGVSRCSR